MVEYSITAGQEMGRWILGNPGHGAGRVGAAAPGVAARARSQCADLLLLPLFTQGVQQDGPMGYRQWPETEPRRIDNRQTVHSRLARPDQSRRRHPDKRQRQNTSYINGQHNAQAMLDQGARRTITHQVALPRIFSGGTGRRSDVLPGIGRRTAPGLLAGANDIKPGGVSNSHGLTEPGVPAEDRYAINTITEAPTSPIGRRQPG
jgi:hypothetical protein